MKKFLWILGGLVCVALIVAAMYVALTIGLSVYIAYTNQMRGKAYREHVAQLEQQQMRQQIDSLGNNMTPDLVENKAYADELAGKLPTLFVDPEGYGTEDNWLATTISREIAEMASVTVHPASPLLDLKIKAKVDPDKPQVQVEIGGFGPDTITSDLTPAFAWDPEGYAPLARQLLGTTPGVAAQTVSDENDVLTHLLNLTGPKIAAEDVRLSANLQQHPASWQDHEAAALVLMAMALREVAGTYTERRLMLCRATAHLAVAQALRGDRPASWPGLIAGAAIRTFSGRELDALAHLDNLSAQADLPGSAKPWIAALRVLATQDWRKAEVTPKSPLLLKIVWFQILELDLIDKVANRHLEAVVPQPSPDPNLPPDEQKTNPETLIPDWGRIAGRSPFYELSSDDAKNEEYKLDLEFHELDEILKIEGAAPFDLDHLASVYSEPETDTVSLDSGGKTVVRVIGPGGFKNASRRQVLADIVSKSPEPDSAQDPAQIEIIFTKFDALLHGVPGYDLERLQLGFKEVGEQKKQIADWIAAKKTWRIWEVPYQDVLGMPGYGRVKNFYRNVVPFGTVFESGTANRYGFIQSQVKIPLYDTPELERIKKLPVDQAIRAVNDYNKKYNESIQKQAPGGPLPLDEKWLKLDPDDYVLVAEGVPDDKLMAAAARFLDYNLNPIEKIERLDAEHLSVADREIITRKHAVLEPVFYFDLANLLRSEGKDDEGADADRQGLAQADDPSSALGYAYSLVEYDLDHGRFDEALSLAKKAADLGDEDGLNMYFDVLESTGRLDEAAVVAKKITDTFDDTWAEIALYAGHPKHFPVQEAAEKKRIMPDGLKKVDLASFSGVPTQGMTFDVARDGDSRTDWLFQASHLRRDDRIVGLDGYKVDTAMQYFYIQALSRSSTMDFIVWRDGKYQEVRAHVPHRRFPFSVG